MEEDGLEGGNGEGEGMFFVGEDEGMREGKGVGFGGGEIGGEVKERYGEVEEFVGLGKVDLV